MKPRTALIGVALAACAAFAVPTQDPKPEDPTKRIDALVRALDIEKKKTASLELRVERIETWFAAVRSASLILDAAANDARRNGFEHAGPNAAARTNILEGMKGFAAELTRSAPISLSPR